MMHACDFTAEYLSRFIWEGFFAQRRRDRRENNNVNRISAVSALLREIILKEEAALTSDPFGETTAFSLDLVAEVKP
jgi:hypothetical protein